MIRIVEFKTEYRPNREPVDWVLVGPVGADFDKTQTWHRVSKIRPPDTTDENYKKSDTYLDMAAKWSIIGPAYDAWKSGEELPEDGTPLAAWPGVSKDQAEALKSVGINTVEAVRDMPEDMKGKLKMPNIHQLPKLAGDYLEGASAAQKDAEIADMREKMAAMEEMLKESMAKPKRRKKETEAA